MLKPVNPAQTSQIYKSLNSSIAIPSYIHIYSVTTEYIKEWFLNKFNTGFFKNININDKHILDEFRIKTKDEMVKLNKPRLSITPAIDYDYDCDTLNHNQFGLDLLVQRGTIDRCFIKDYRRNLFIGMGIEELKFGYTFKMIFSTKTQQMDIYKFINMAFSIGSTKTLPIDLDFHIPYSLMLQLATDMNIGVVEDEKITNVIYFLNCLNSISELPIMYKLNTGSGRHEFYIRMKNSSIYIKSIDKVSVDEGEYEGMLKNDFGLEFNIEILIPGPKLYVYYSEEGRHNISLLESNNNDIFNNEDELRYTISLNRLPEVDENGWTQYLTTQYEQQKDLSEINFIPLFKDLRLLDMINHYNDMNIDPKTFINIKMFIGDIELLYNMNWDTLLLTLNNIVDMKTIYIVLYMDTKLITEYSYIKEKLDKRYKDTE